MSPSAAVERILEQSFAEMPGTTVLVAFSGGPDSTALLAGLGAVAPRLGLRVHAAHLDHGLDPDSPRRAALARRLAGEIGVPFHASRLEPAALEEALAAGLGREAAARRARYAFLEQNAQELGATVIVTAHHGGDQAETVLLRLAAGSGLFGLAGIRPRRGRLVRPLLGLTRDELEASLGGRFEPVLDPTNRDLETPRNRVRHVLLPLLEEREPGVAARLTGLATAARRATARIETLLDELLMPRPVPYGRGIRVDRAAFEALPEALVPHALALLHRRAGAPYPAASAARRELLRQLRSPGRAGCDCGAGWRWEAASGVLELVRRESTTVEFAYTLEVPGEVAIPEIGILFRLRTGEVADWMFASHPGRAGLAIPPRTGGVEPSIEVRCRRTGDRLTPFGHRRRRRLKDVLIDRRVPRRQRDRLPLLVVDGEIAWVPGVALSERFRLTSGGRAWIAETLDLVGHQTSSAHPSPSQQERLEL